MTDVAKDAALSSPSATKKLKQARLPFAVLPTKEVQPLQSTPTSGKKRKLSDSAAGPNKAPKTPRNEENYLKLRSTPSSVKGIDGTDNEVSSSSETDAKNKELKNEEKKDKVKKSSVWDQFRRSPQKPEVSTTNTVESSGIVDLTDSNDASTNSTECTPDKYSKAAKDGKDKLESNNKSFREKTKDTPKDQSSDTSDTNENKDSVKNSTNAENQGDDQKDVDKSVNDSVLSLHSEVDSEMGEDSSDHQNSAGETSPSKTSNNEDEEDDVDKSINVSALSLQSEAESEKGEEGSDRQTSTDETNKTPKTARSTRKKPPGSNKELEKQQRKEEFEKARLERQKQKEEKERQRKEEKEKKEQEREELKKKKEQERKEKLEQREKERLEKIKQKEEEKQKKEDERLQKLEQKKKELEEKQRQKEEQEKEKQRLKEEKEREKQIEEESKNKIVNIQKNAFMSFFTKKEKVETTTKEEEVNSRFLQFEVKEHMKLAPLMRRPEDEIDSLKDKLDSYLKSQNCKRTYLKTLRIVDYEPGHSSRTLSAVEDDVVCLEEDAKPKQRMRVKFLKFHENYRPPYYGTWRKKSRYIGPRNPLGKDTVQLDYEVDSDDEWEEEEPGESLSDCEKGSDNEEENEDDDDEADGFFVPHGYLSEGEGCEDEEEEVTPERLKMRQQAKVKQWEQEMSAKVVALRAVCFGCLWWSPERTTRSPELDELAKYMAVPLTPFPVSLEVSAKPEKGETGKKQKAEKSQIRPVPEEAIPDLIRLVHGNPWSIQKLISEFREYWRLQQKKQNGADAGNGCEVTKGGADASESQNDDEEALNTSQESPTLSLGISKRQIYKTIREMATYSQGHWLVNDNMLQKHKLTELPVPNEWKWVTKEPKKKRKIPTPCPTPTETPEPVPNPRQPKEATTPKLKNDIAKVSDSPMPMTNVVDIKEMARNSPKGANTQSIMKFAKPRVSPKPCPTPKGSWNTPVSAVTSTPVSAKPDSATPKSKKGCTLTPKNLVTKAANESLSEEQEEEPKMELKTDKNQPKILTMFGKTGSNVASKSRSEKSKEIVNVTGSGTEDCPMEVD